MLHDIWQAETREDAGKAFDLFIESYEAKYPKATECLIKDRDELLTFFCFPAQHLQSIRTLNPIENAFATIRHRTKQTKGCLSRDSMLHIPLIALLRNATAGQWMFKLGKCAEKSWRKLHGLAHLADVIQGIDFVNGIMPSNQIKPPHDHRLDTRLDNSSQSDPCSLLQHSIAQGRKSDEGCFLFWLRAR